MEALTEMELELPKVHRGKVRDTYTLNNHLLMVASDRLSAFDVVFNEGIPMKGKVLNKLSIFWFQRTSDIIKNHFITDAIPSSLPEYLQGRSMIVKKTEPLPIECVVRGYLTGSAWKDYRKGGSVCGIRLPEGLRNGSELPHPIFTPAFKAKTGHDENITEEKAIELVGENSYKFVKQKSIELYNFGKAHAKKCGLILVDTKFEFGELTDAEGHKSIIVIDEMLTPDSSRYWIKERHDQGIIESLDKQYVRDYLEKTKWDKNPPPPELPADVVEKTTERYLEAYKRLTGKGLE
ncbi:MAG: phosphoribosylaminoimidazolesuccinocarboxamide synthase [Candidatus Micrarchaeota archaeon]